MLKRITGSEAGGDVVFGPLCFTAMKMLQTTCSQLLVLSCAAAVGAGVGAQDPAQDLPWQHRGAAASPASWCELGLLRLEAGFAWEARRCFRELGLMTPASPMPVLLQALAHRDQPLVAARLCWRAHERATALVTVSPLAGVIAAYCAYYELDALPELGDPRFAEPPPPSRHQALVATLADLVAGEACGVRETMTARLLAWERAAVAKPAAPAVLAPAAAAAQLRRTHAYLAATGAMPFQVPGYRQLLVAAGRDAELARLPRHPDWPVAGGAVRWSDALRLPAGEAGVLWSPRKAPGYDLPRGLGGRGRSADHRGKPRLLVFFLGFG